MVSLIDAQLRGKLISKIFQQETVSQRLLYSLLKLAVLVSVERMREQHMLLNSKLSLLK